MVLPTAAFPSSSAALKAGVLLGFALQHGLLASGIPLSHNLLTKSRWIWGGVPRFSHLLPGSQPGQGHCSFPQNQSCYGGHGEIHPTKAEPQFLPNPSGMGAANAVGRSIRLLWFQAGI